MVDINSWMKEFEDKVETLFSHRVCFIGLQGSYARDEATETSDIDVVVILDELCINDLKTYRDMLDTLPNRKLICGFISGKNELLNWESSDLFQFYYDTTPIKGTLDFLLNKLDKKSVERAIKIGSCNIYHSCVHNFVHDKDERLLRSLYKSAVFVIQAIVFCDTGKFFRSKTELRNAIDPHSAVLDTAIELNNGAAVDFEKMSALLLDWASGIIAGGVR